MGFRCDAKTLERLEWGRLVAALRQCAATARGRDACDRDLFAQTHAGARELLAETREARLLLDAGTPLRLSEVGDERPLLEALAIGRLPEPDQLAGLARTLRTALALRRSLASDARIPRLADLVSTLPELSALAGALEAVVTPTGEVREDATPELGRLRRRERELEHDIERRMAALLRHPDVQRDLQEGYVTSRNDRPVLPVKAEARRRVRGIVHDLSASGTTVFIEPESVIDLGNRLRMARREIEHEVDRILRELGDRCQAEIDGIEATGATLEHLDLALARARLAGRLGAHDVEPLEAGALELRSLAHPLLALEAGLPGGGVPNDVVLDEQVRGLVISGPNAGGKTVLAKAVGLAALCLRAGLQVLCGSDSRMPLFDAVFADIGDAQDLRSGLSTFSARMENLAQIVAGAGPLTLVILDEIGEGTEPSEGAALAQAALEELVERGASVIATTHFNRLKELAGDDPRFVNACAEFDPEDLSPTYRVTLGVPGLSGAVWVAQRMGLHASVIDRARSLMDGEERKLEALTRDLSELRQQLETERESARSAREESSAARDAYAARIERLSEAREEALRSMGAELEDSYRQARSEIAEIMRRLQRGSEPDGREANRALEALAELRERVEQSEARHRPKRPPMRRGEVVWEQLEPGARLEVEGLLGPVVLVELPDRRGRIVVRKGSARMTLEARRVRAVLSEPVGAARSEPAPSRVRIEVERVHEPIGLCPECDLRGLRVDEALDRAEAHLGHVLGSGVSSVSFIHGHGTGALRSAIREWLRAAPGVESFGAAPQSLGGEGVTIAQLRG